MSFELIEALKSHGIDDFENWDDDGKSEFDEIYHKNKPISKWEINEDPICSCFSTNEKTQIRNNNSLHKTKDISKSLNNITDIFVSNALGILDKESQSKNSNTGKKIQEKEGEENKKKDIEILIVKRPTAKKKRNKSNRKKRSNRKIQRSQRNRY